MKHEKREYAISLIEAFLRFLHDNGYTDSDVYDERPTAVDQFMEEYSEYFTIEQLESEGEKTKTITDILWVECNRKSDLLDKAIFNDGVSIETINQIFGEAAVKIKAKLTPPSQQSVSKEKNRYRNGFDSENLPGDMNMM